MRQKTGYVITFFNVKTKKKSYWVEKRRGRAFLRIV